MPNDKRKNVTLIREFWFQSFFSEKRGLKHTKKNVMKKLNQLYTGIGLYTIIIVLFSFAFLLKQMINEN